MNLNTVRHVYDNGVILLMCKRQAESVEIGFYNCSGSMSEYENDFKHGLSHFTEHALFLGANGMSQKEMTERLNKCGNFNAYTSNEEIKVHITCLKENVVDSIKAIGDMYYKASFDENLVIRERDVITQEYLMHIANNSSLYYDKFDKEYYNIDPILGTEESINSITSEDCRNYWNYTRDNYKFIITIVGNIDFDQCKDEVGKVISQSERKGNKVLDFNLEDFVVKNNTIEVNTDMPTSIVTMHNHLPYKFGERNYLALAIANNILGDGMGSMLFEEIRNKMGSVYSICSSNSSIVSAIPNRVHKIMWHTEPSNVDKVKNKIVEVVSKMSDNITSDMIEIEKIKFNRSMRFSIDYNIVIGNYMYNSEVSGIDTINYKKQIMDITNAEVMDCVKDLEKSITNYSFTKSVPKQ